MNKTFSVGIFLLIISLVAVNIYLFLRSRPVVNIGANDIPNKNTAEISDEDLQWEKYVDDKYGYSVSYPNILEPKEIENDDYLRFNIFFVPSGVQGPGFGVSVRDNSLSSEVELIKQEIGLGLQARLNKEEEIIIGGFSGTRLEFEPTTKEEGEAKTLVIINNGKYSYTISSTPDFIDEILENFNIEN